MKCPYCNVNLKKGTNKCPYCGKSVDQTNDTTIIIDEENNPHRKQNFNRDYLIEYKEFWIRFADFKGKSGVKQFWLAFLFNIIALLIAVLTYVLIIPYSVLMIVPMVAIMVRRLNDLGLPFWFIFIFLIPGAGYIVLLILFCFPSGYFEKFKN